MSVSGSGGTVGSGECVVSREMSMCQGDASLLG